jgi:hypothetical protein
MTSIGRVAPGFTSSIEDTVAAGEDRLQNQGRMST